MIRNPTILSLAFGCVLACLATLASCNIVTPIALAVSPPPTQDAEYLLPDRTTVVYVDDRQNSLNDRGLRMFIGDKVAEHLMREKALTDTIKTSDAMAAAGGERTGGLKSLEQIGRDVGAAQLIYVELVSFGLQSNTEGAPRAQANVQVKVIDVENRTRLYPTADPAGQLPDSRSITVTLPPEQTYQPMLTRAAQAEAERTLSNMIADRVAKLFYEWEIRPLGEASAPKSVFDN